MFAFTVGTGSFSATARSMKSLLDVTTVSRAVGGAMGSVLAAAVAGNIGYTDHSLADLVRLGHPYARRHGTIKIHGGDQKVVHKQSGAMASSLRSELLPSSSSDTGEAWTVWFDLARAPHARFVVMGTRYMLPRDVLWLTAADPPVQKQMMRAVTRVLGAELRTKASVRFSAR